MWLLIVLDLFLWSVFRYGFSHSRCLHGNGLWTAMPEWSDTTDKGLEGTRHGCQSCLREENRYVILLLCKCKLNVWQLPCNFSCMKLLISKHIVDLCMNYLYPFVFVYRKCSTWTCIWFLLKSLSQNVYPSCAFIMDSMWEVLKVSFTVKYMKSVTKHEDLSLTLCCSFFHEHWKGCIPGNASSQCRTTIPYGGKPRYIIKFVGRRHQ